MNNVVSAKFGETPEKFVDHAGNKTPVYRDENNRPYIMVHVKDDCPEENTKGKRTKWAEVKRYIDTNLPDPAVTRQYENPIYGD